MIGRKIHHYQITEKLGEGGMGVVYRAEDTSLHRTVALKFLHPAIVARPEDQQRLVVEARAAAGLGHPNICTVYEINEIDGQTFIAMQFVEGTTLRDRVLSGRIETVDALRYLIQIADGLREAHRKGIVHRDMKSSNIMVTPPGRAVIMDFGLARPVGQGKMDERFTSRGTSAYMSPEQARGEPVDQRTDIWSLGVVLYEMLAGQLPFRGDYESAVLYSILNESHQPIAGFRDGLPAGVVKIVERCLAKDPAERFQSLDELIDALRLALDALTGVRRFETRPSRLRLVGIAAASVLTLVAAFVSYDFLRGRVAGGQERVPIAVIDFDNETDEAALDGLSGMLITALEQSRRLSVMTRSRMFDVMKTLGRTNVEKVDESMGQQICDAVGVGALVIPTVRRFGDLYTIELKIMNTRTHKYIYTTRKEGRGQESIPAMIDAIAREIRIDLRETSEAVARAAPVGEVTTTNLDAYQAYFEGETLLNDLDFTDAAKAFERAIGRDSTFALAHYRLGYVEWWTRGHPDETRHHIAYALSHLDRIPQKERYLVRALQASLDGGFEAQLPVLKEMRLLYPEDKEMLFGLGDAEFHSAQYDSAAVHFRAALAVDPNMDRALQHLTWTYLRLDRNADAVKTAERWVQVAPSAEAYEYLAHAHFKRNDLTRASQILEAVSKRYPDSPKIPLRVASIQFATGKPYEALKSLDAAARLAQESGDMPSLFEVGSTRAMVIYPFLGKYRMAFETLDQGRRLMLKSLDDSTYVVNFALSRAALEYWAYQDPRRSLAVLDGLRGISPRQQTPDYLRSIAVFSILSGDTAHANDIIRTHRARLTPLRVDMLEMLEAARRGDCAAADAMARRLPGEKGFVGAYEASMDYSLGLCLLQGGDYAGAVARFRKITDTPTVAVEVATMYAMTWLRLGVAYEKSGQTAAAMDCYRRVLTLLKDGDEDLASRREARERLDRLTASGTM
ncbi:MAG TPA: protein kinase [Candidatus Krumholzibacteria bacterium]|nr:protein kinase [Candidatus Krumholzibacteria bacterium]